MANSSESQKVITLFDARTTDMEKKIARLERKTKGSFARNEKAVRGFNQEMRKSSAAAGKLLKSVGSLPFAGAAAGALSLAGALTLAKQGLEDFDKVAKTARQNGLSGEFYQTLAFMAGEASIETSTLDTALRKFTIGVGEAKFETGELYSALEKADRGLLRALVNASSGEERLRRYADAVSKAKTAEEKALLVKAGFGQRGTDLVRVLELGSDAMDKAGRKASALGNIIENDVLEQAEEMQNRLGNASDALDKQLKASLIDIGPYLINFSENMAGAVKKARELKEAVKGGFGNFSKGMSGLIGSTFDPDIDLLTGKDGSPFKPDSFSTGYLGKALAKIEADRGILNKRLMATQERLNSGSLSQTFLNTESMKEAALLEQISALETKLQLVQEILDQRSKNSNKLASSSENLPGSTIPTARVAVPTSKPVLGVDDLAGTYRSKSAKDAIRQAQAVERVIAVLKHERDLIGKTEMQQRLLNQIRAAGAGATKKQKQEIESLVRGIDNQRAAQEQLNQVSQFGGQLISDQFSQITAAIDTGSTALDQFIQLMTDAAIQAAVFGTGPLGSMFGGGASGSSSNSGGLVSTLATIASSLFGFDGGGWTGPGGKYTPKGIVHGDEYVFSREATRKLGVANLDALHKSAKGFARGGFVGGPVPMIPKPAAILAPANRNTPSEIRLVVEGSSEFDVRVVGVAGPVAVQIVDQAKPGIIKAATAQSRGNVVNDLNAYEQNKGGSWLG
ncbi:hypothetical protein PsW64_05210 [Pseudovibrio sp. W64]|uniref:hypothetical protein n=1 Tax=Pseudovibrio sp. W64 TaxID=1735583 RepID=UPI0007AE3DF0|nr:hypothetical protein [Pseudovibrio sp. W64]KZK76481.1 hypothetical protein PsW64_05210 [Pseudovibrio sp. W64]